MCRKQLLREQWKNDNKRSGRRSLYAVSEGLRRGRSMNYKKLFEPIKIGNVTLKNRFVMPAMDSSTTTSEHTFSEQSMEYFAARAKGGFALIITEFMAVDPSGFATPNQVGIYNDSFIPNLKKLTDRIHEYNGKCCAQIHHGGIQTMSKTCGGTPLAVSGILVKKYSKDFNVVMLSGYQFILGGFVMIVVGLALGGRINLVPQFSAYLLLLYMALISAVAYSVWGILMKYNPVSRVSIFNFLTPLFGVLLSAIFLGEVEQALSWNKLAALILVSSGIYIVNRKYEKA